MNGDGNGYVPELSPETFPVAPLLTAVRENLPAARAESDDIQKRHSSRRRELHRAIIRLREEYRRGCAEQRPGDVMTVALGALLGFLVMAMLYSRFSEIGGRHGSREAGR